jgi:pimeloyl-ACP methyl ester carboxylesterase
MKLFNSCQSVTTFREANDINWASNLWRAWEAKFVSGIFLVLLFLGAFFWARQQDPFSRKWFTLKTADHSPFKCVAVPPKPVRQYPAIIFAHGSGEDLLKDGTMLRQMAEMGLVAVSWEYDKTNQVKFEAQFESLLNYLGRQKWVDTNAIAWVGFSLGAIRTLDFALQHPEQQPQLLVQLGGAGVEEPVGKSEIPDTNSTPSTISLQLLAAQKRSDGGSTNLHCPVLFVHGEQDEVFPVENTKRLASVLQTNGLSVELKIIPGVSHGMELERSVVFRSIGEYCLTHLVGKDAWQNYHSIAQWQAQAPALWLFWLPAAAWVAGWLVWRLRNFPSPIPVGQNCRSAPISPPAASAVMPTESPAGISLGSFWRKFRRRGNAALPWRPCPLKRSEIMLRWLAVLVATWALAETAIHLVTPQFTINDTTLSIARRFLIQPKERADFECLAAQPIWHGHKLKTLLEHAELAGYNRELIDWQLDDRIYQEYVLSPAIEPSTFNTQLSSNLNWRRPLWEEFYPRIRHESSPEDAAKIVVRHLRERVTIAALPNLSHNVPDIWLKQITDETGFEIIYVAALRSVGVPARLDSNNHTEFWDGNKWQIAPPPPVISW